MIYSNKQGSDFIHLSDLNKILFSSTAMDSKRCGRDCYVVKAELDLIVGTFRTVTVTVWNKLAKVRKRGVTPDKNVTCNRNEN